MAIIVFVGNLAACNCYQYGDGLKSIDFRVLRANGDEHQEQVIDSEKVAMASAVVKCAIASCILAMWTADSTAYPNDVRLIGGKIDVVFPEGLQQQMPAAPLRFGVRTTDVDMTKFDVGEKVTVWAIMLVLDAKSGERMADHQSGFSADIQEGHGATKLEGRTGVITLPVGRYIYSIIILGQVANEAPRVLDSRIINFRIVDRSKLGSEDD